MIYRLMDLEPVEAKLLLPIFNIAYALIEKAFKNRGESVEPTIASWFTSTSQILMDSVEIDFDCSIDVSDTYYNEIVLIKDMILDTTPYYVEETKKLYIGIAVKLDKAIQYYNVMKSEGGYQWK